MFNFKVSKAIRELDEYQKIVDGFKAHKNGDTPAFLGRDVGYDHPDTPRLVREYLTHIPYVCQQMLITTKRGCRTLKASRNKLKE